MAGSFSLGSSSADAAARPSMSLHHREVLSRLERQATARNDTYQGEVLFSRVNSDRYADPHELNTRFTDSEVEAPTPLARAVLSGAFARQHRDMLGEAASVHMYIFATLPEAERTDAERDADGGMGGGISGALSRVSQKFGDILAGRGGLLVAHARQAIIVVVVITLMAHSLLF